MHAAVEARERGRGNGINGRRVVVVGGGAGIREGVVVPRG